MNAAILVLALTPALTQLADTTVAVPPNARLEMHVMGGTIDVDTWDADEIRIRAETGRRESIRIRTTNSVVRIDAQRENGFPGSGTVNYRLTVPVSMGLELSGTNVDIELNGNGGEVSASVVSGDVIAREIRGPLTVQSVSGNVLVENAAGSVTAISTSGNVLVRDVRGRLDAKAVSGNVILEQITSADVAAYSVSGRIHFEGSIAPGGVYALASHSGSVTVVTSSALDATLTLATNSGRFSSSISTLSTINHPRGRRLSYTIGGGSATVEIETFSGNIRILTPEEAPPP
jgi:DUF4097 and DUF4098 domain-containing protein YvlB